MNNYYEIEQIDKIKEIINQSKSDVETVCKNLGLKDEKIKSTKKFYSKRTNENPLNLDLTIKLRSLKRN